MNEGVVSWNIPNVITVTLMTLIFFTVAGALWGLFGSKNGMAKAVNGVA